MHMISYLHHGSSLHNKKKLLHFKLLIKNLRLHDVRSSDPTPGYFSRSELLPAQQGFTDI